MCRIEKKEIGERMGIERVEGGKGGKEWLGERGESRGSHGDRGSEGEVKGHNCQRHLAVGAVTNV